MTNVIKYFLPVLFVLFGGFTGVAEEPSGEKEAWGTLRGRFIYRGKVPARKPLSIARPIPGVDESIFDESLMINDKNGGLANVVITLDPGRRTRPPIHPSYADSASGEVEIESVGGRYKSRINLIRTGQTVQLVNGDPVANNFKIDSFANSSYNLLVPRSSRTALPRSFKDPEPLPVMVSSSVYPWIRGRLIVQDHPYTAVTDADGRFVLKNLPVGNWRFRVWHERCGYLREVVRGMVKEEWNLGRVEFAINPGDNDLREFYVDKKILVPRAAS